MVQLGGWVPACTLNHGAPLSSQLETEVGNLWSDASLPAGLFIMERGLHFHCSVWQRTKGSCCIHQTLDTSTVKQVRQVLLLKVNSIAPRRTGTCLLCPINSHGRESVAAALIDGQALLCCRAFDSSSASRVICSADLCCDVSSFCFLLPLQGERKRCAWRGEICWCDLLSTCPLSCFG